MASFNYSNLRFFQKDGTELMVSRVNSCVMTIKNQKHPSEHAKYAFINGDSSLATSSFLCLESGSRFTLGEDLDITVTCPRGEYVESSLPSSYYTEESYTSSNGTEYYPKPTYNDLDASNKSDFLNSIGISEKVDGVFPTTLLDLNLEFDKVSTNLVETQSLIILTESDSSTDGQSSLVDVKTYSSTHPDASTYINEYKLMFFIDCRENKDFRFFYLNGDEVVWTDRMYVDFNNGVRTGVDNGYRVDIGFVGEDEGVYESKMYICLIRKSDNEINVIGTVNLTAETEGLDERYKTLFTNFGLPDMDDLEKAFKDTDPSEALPDNISINKHAKKVFLSYSEIFPYSGSYKALFNAMRLLGYDDVYFKEWYKEIGESTKDDYGYVAYDITDSFRTGLHTINTKPIEERIHLKKLNWVSMVYKLNESIDSSIDQYGFPATVNLENYYTTGSLVKLISLKDCIDKYVSGINCRITDIGGEGIVFERYQATPYGQYQQVLDYVENKHIATVIESPVSILKDSSAYIRASINTVKEDVEIENFDGRTIADFCEGYFDSTYTYRDVKDSSTVIDSSSYTYFGKTFELNDNMNTFELRAIGKCDSFRFGSDFIDSSCPTLIVDDNKVIFDPHDLLTKRRNAAFKNLPIIQIYEGRIKRYVKDMETFGELAYDSSIRTSEVDGYTTIIKIADYESNTEEKYEINEPLTIVPPLYTYNATYSYITPRFSAQNTRRNTGRYSTLSNQIDITDKTFGLRYVTSDINGIPTFMIAGYECPRMYLYEPKIHYPLTNDSSGAEPYEYYVEITKGRMIFADTVNERKVILNFDYVDGKRLVYVSTYQFSRGFTLNEYKTSSSNYVQRFQPGVAYQYFVSNYKSNPEPVVILHKEHEIKVYNTGRYEIDSVLLDEHNNMFAHKANGMCVVLSPDIDASTYSYDSSSLNDYKQAGTAATSNEISGITTLINNDENKCIFSYERKRNIRLKDGSVYYMSGTDTIDSSRIDNGSTIFSIDSSYELADLTSNSVRFVCVAYNKPATGNLFLSLIRRSYRDSSAGPVMIDSYGDVVSSCTKEAISENLEIDATLMAFMSLTSYSDSGSPLDVNITLYDETTECPILSYPGIMMSTKNFKGDSSTYSLDEYRVFINTSIVEGGENSDIDEIINYLKNPYVSVYVNPCWNMIVETFDDSSVFLEEKNEIDYPFAKILPKGDCYRLSFSKLNGGYKHFGNFSVNVGDMIVGEHEHHGGYLGTEIGTDTFIRSSGSAGFKYFLAPSTQEYTKYTLELDEKLSDPGNGVIALKNTNWNREVGKYIDTGYAVTLRNFDSNNGILMWSDSSISNISNQYSYNCPITTTNGFVTVVPVLTEGFSGNSPIDILTSEKYTAKWSIYKQHGESKRKLLVECYNNVLYLELPEKGIYDIDLTVYDKNGNKYCKFLDGAIYYK